MAKEDIYQHNFRLNLNDPKQLKIHKKLLTFNKEVYKSKNDYIVKMMYEGIFGDENVLDEDLIGEMEERIVQKVTAQLIKTLLDGSGGKEFSGSEEKNPEVDNEVASVALGYFDDEDEEIY